MELLNYFTLGIAALGFIISVYTFFRLTNLENHAGTLDDRVALNQKTINDVGDSLLNLRKNFNAKVLEVLEELSGQEGNVFSSWIGEIDELSDDSEAYAAETERRLFELENPLTGKAQFFDEDEGFDVIKTNSGFRFKRNGKSEDIDSDAFYDLWFSGEIRKADA